MAAMWKDVLQAPSAELACRRASAGVPGAAVAASEDVFVWKDFVDAASEAQLLAILAAVPRSRWQLLHGRSTQQWGGRPLARGKFLAETLPWWLTSLFDNIQEKCGMFMPGALNHCLVNEYPMGSGILPHQDGPWYAPCVAILSLGDSEATMVFTPNVDTPSRDADSESLPSFAVHLPRRSLLLFCGAAYLHYRHGIEKCSGPGSRTSLTCRVVRTVSKGLASALARKSSS